MTQATKKDIGKWCKFENDDDTEVCIEKLFSIIYYKETKVFESSFLNRHWNICTTLTEEQIKVLGLEE